MSGRLADRVALITGAGLGLGRATAVLFAEEGAAVVAFDIDPVGTEETACRIQSAGGSAIALTGDVTLEKDVEDAVRQTTAGLGSIDVLAPAPELPGRWTSSRTSMPRAGTA